MPAMTVQPSRSPASARSGGPSGSATPPRRATPKPSREAPWRSLTAALTLLVIGFVPRAASAEKTGPHRPEQGVLCGDCHFTHGSGGGMMAIVPHGDDQEALCQSCHNPTGVASSLVNISNHGAMDCGTCHDPHAAMQSDDPHPGGVTADNRSLIRSDMRKYFSAALEPTVFQRSPDDFVFTDAPYDGVCQTCHTATSYHRNSAAGDHTHQREQSCVLCHPHEDGFAPHFSAGHAIHLDDPRGPRMSCLSGDQGCHGASPLPLLSDGGTLATTTVCDTCHSPGGDYDGVDDPVIGARTNWRDGVYSDESTLKPGKERWCVGCHDGSPSVISGVSAPDVAGDDDTPTDWAGGFGFFITGHGLERTKAYPNSGGVAPGAGLGCGDCHDLASTHIDGDAQTYSASAALGSDQDFEHGYRLSKVDGLAPMAVPHIDDWPPDGPKTADFRLCARCHTSGVFTDRYNTDSNFRRDGSNHPSAHFRHLGRGHGPFWDSDHDGEKDSVGSCVACHNVHGTASGAMYRLQMVYWKPPVHYTCNNYPYPAYTSLPESVGTVYRNNTSAICAGCHGSCGFDARYDRVPVDLYGPWIEAVSAQVGGDTLTLRLSEGAYANPDASGALTASDFVLSDLDDGRQIVAVSHAAGSASAILTLSAPLDASDDLDTDTLAAAPSAIFDAGGRAASDNAVTLEDPDAQPKLLTLHPADHVALDYPLYPANGADVHECVPTGGAWSDILDSDDGNTTYAACWTDFWPGRLPRESTQFVLEMDDPVGIDSAAIVDLRVSARFSTPALTRCCGTPPAKLQVCYETGTGTARCSAVIPWSLIRTDYLDVWVPTTTKDPDETPLDIHDLNNLRVTVTVDSNLGVEGELWVTELRADIHYLE